MLAKLQILLVFIELTLRLQGLLCSHDAVAQKDYYPRLPEIPQDIDEDEETVKIVQLVKSNEPLVGVLFHSLLFRVPKFVGLLGLVKAKQFLT